MKDMAMSSRVLRAVARVPKSEKSQRHHSKSKSLPKPVRSRNSLAWYVALNKEPENEKILCDSRVQWKCPPKFYLNPQWLVTAGEESLEMKAQMHRETTVLAAVCSGPSAIPPNPSSPANMKSDYCDDACIQIVPIIPVEEATAEEETKSPLFSSAFGNQPRPVNDNSLLDKLRGLEGTDLEVAVAAAATVAAVMESEQQIDTQLLIKLLSDPEMVKKLVDGSTPNSNPGHGFLPAAPLPNPEMVKKLVDGSKLSSNPRDGSLLATPKPTFVDKQTNESSKQLSRSFPPNTMPAQVLNQPFSPICTKVKTAGNAPMCTSRLPHGPTHIHPSNTRPLQVLNQPLSPVRTKVGTAGNAPICAPSLPPGPHTHQIAGVNQVRPLIPSTVRPDDETMKKSSIRQQEPMYPYVEKPSMDEIKKLINKYGASNASPVDQSVELQDDHLHRWGPNPNPPFHSSNPLHPAMVMPRMANMPPPGISHFPPFSAKTNAGPPLHSNYNNFTNGHMLETPEHTPLKLGLAGNCMQGLQLRHNKNKPNDMNPKFHKPCMYFNTPKGCRNGSKCPYEHGEVAKRMKFSR